MADKRPFYVTTPIYYITDKPHIGHLYTTVAADILARYHRMRGDDTWFLTGTDEHGQKVLKQATENNETAQALADRMVERYKNAWKLYNITYDDFIRTTEARHKKVVTRYMEELIKTGDMYLSEYEGWYCVPDEAYWTESQIVDGKCPDCGRPLEKLKEESYFFKMSAYEQKLLAHIEANPDFIQPESRRNEVVGFIRQGLKDISASRTTIKWGIPMPKNPKTTREHTVYVWFDALTNYLSALQDDEGGEKIARYWQSVVHLVGKDILRFHAVYWPTFLMALKLPLPKHIVAHGWLTNAGLKMSKSLKNVVDPMDLATEVGVDGLRYFLFREFAFGQDGEYTKETMYTRINADLANDYGNCISRTCSMIVKSLGSAPLDLTPVLEQDSEVKKLVPAALAGYHEAVGKFSFNKALESIWTLVTGVNRFIDASAPWALAKSADPADRKKLEVVLLHCHEALRIVSICLMPFIPNSVPKAMEVLGDTQSLTSARPMEAALWQKGPAKITVQKGTPLFPRLEWKPEPT